MSDIRIEQIGFYERIELDDRGLPKPGQLPIDVIRPGLGEFTLYIRLSGQPGSYWLTIDVKSEGQKADVTLSVPPQYITVPIGGDTHLAIPFSIKPLPRGAYVFTLQIANRRLARFGFVIE